MREDKAAEGAPKKMTEKQMQENAERMYYRPVTKAKSKVPVHSEETVPKKKFNEGQQNENIERLYYQARERQHDTARRATERQEAEFTEAQMHNTKATFQQQLDVADRLYYKATDTKRAKHYQADEHAAKRARSAKRPTGMTQSGWNNTVSRLYQPHTAKGNIFDETAHQSARAEQEAAANGTEPPRSTHQSEKQEKQAG